MLNQQTQKNSFPGPAYSSYLTRVNCGADQLLSGCEHYVYRLDGLKDEGPERVSPE